MKKWLQHMRCWLKGGHDMEMVFADTPPSINWTLICSRCGKATTDLGEATLFLTSYD